MLVVATRRSADPGRYGSGPDTAESSAAGGNDPVPETARCEPVPSGADGRGTIWNNPVPDTAGVRDDPVGTRARRRVCRRAECGRARVGNRAVGARARVSGGPVPGAVILTGDRLGHGAGAPRR